MSACARSRSRDAPGAHLGRSAACTWAGLRARDAGSCLRARARARDRRLVLRDQPHALDRHPGRRRAVSARRRLRREVEAIGFPGLGRFISWHGTIAVRRGESDRDAVRAMREAARNGRVVGLFVEGTRQKTGRPGKRPAGRRDGRAPGGVPVVPIAVYGTQFWKHRQLRAVLGRVRRAGALRRAAARAAAATRRRPPRSSGASTSSSTGSPTSTRRAGPRSDVTATVCEQHVPSSSKARSRSSGSRTSASRRSINRLTAIARGRRARDAGHDARPQGARLRVERRSVPADRHGRRRHRRPSPITKQIAMQARAAIDEADLVLFVVDARAGVTPGDEELAEILRSAKKPCWCSRTRSTTRRRRASRSSSIASASATRSRSRRCTASNTGDLLDEILDLLPGESAGAVGDDAIRVADPRPAERRQVVALQQARRRGADDRLARFPGRRATRSTR